MSILLNIVLLIAALGLLVVMSIAFYLGWKNGPPVLKSMPPPDFNEIMKESKKDMLRKTYARTYISGRLQRGYLTDEDNLK